MIGVVAQGLLWWQELRRWLRRIRSAHAARRAAERELDALFRDPRRLAGTSLRPDHRARCQLLDLTSAPSRIGFGIVRHPRPLRFSSHSDEVVELYCLDVERGVLERVRGINLTRMRSTPAP